MIKVNIGDTFTANIAGFDVNGKIQIENGTVYLCQDRRSGDSCNNKLGYKYSWNVGRVEDLTINSLYRVNVLDFVILSNRKSRIENLHKEKISEKFFKNNSDYFRTASSIIENYVTYTCYSTSNLNSDDTENRYFIIVNDEITEVFEDKFENVDTKKISTDELLEDIKYGFIFKHNDE